MVEFRNPNFKIHQSVTRFCLPLSKFAKLPSNENKSLIVGAAILRPKTVVSTPSKFEAAVLLVRRAPHDSWPNHWEIPGGGSEFGIDQTLLEAVVREAREETGLVVTAITREFEGFEWDTEKKGRYRQYNFIVEVDWKDSAKVWNKGGGEKMFGERVVKLCPEEHSAWMWGTRENIKELEMTPNQRVVVNDALDIAEKLAKA